MANDTDYHLLPPSRSIHFNICFYCGCIADISAIKWLQNLPHSA